MPITLLAAMPADLPLAERVADAMRKRLGTSVVVLPPHLMARGTAAQAIVSHADAPLLDAQLLRLPSPRSSLPRPALIHPDPAPAHFALALRRGLAEVVAWPEEIERWCASAQDGLAPSPERPVAAAAPVRPPSGAANTRAGGLERLIGKSSAMRALRERVARVAQFDCNVLLVGETGSGKECVAHALHAQSPRARGPLVSLNCASLPEHLVESELFGHERGAFTGAHHAQPGKFELAAGGTLFLDEIGELPPGAQAKLLRVIESRDFYRVGGLRPLRADVHLIAATHRDLDAMCAQGTFRQDLQYRLDVARIDLPALRERAGDIVPLAEHFLHQLCAAMRRDLVALAPATRVALRAYPWPGNVRELRNALESALIDSSGGDLDVAHLPARIRSHIWANSPPPDEMSLIVSALERTQWNKSAAARELGWSRMTLYRKLREMGHPAA